MSASQLKAHSCPFAVHCLMSQHRTINLVPKLLLVFSLGVWSKSEHNCARYSKRTIALLVLEFSGPRVLMLQTKGFKI